MLGTGQEQWYSWVMLGCAQFLPAPVVVLKIQNYSQLLGPLYDSQPWMSTPKSSPDSDAIDQARRGQPQGRWIVFVLLWLMKVCTAINALVS